MAGRGKVMGDLWTVWRRMDLEGKYTKKQNVDNLWERHPSLTLPVFIYLFIYLLKKSIFNYIYLLCNTPYASF